MESFIYIFFSESLKLLLFPDVELNPGPRVNAPARCRLLCCNIRGLYTNIRDFSVAATCYDVLLCSETLVSKQRHLSEVRVPGFSRPIVLYRNCRPRVRGMAVYVRDGFCASVYKSHICDCCELQVVRICGGRMNFYVFSVYRNPDIDDHVYDCLLDSMASIQEDDSRAAFIFVGDFNANHAEWLGSPRTDAHGTAARDFADVSGCDQLVSGPTHERGGTLDLLFTDVPDLVTVSVRAPVGGSDHSALSFVVKTNQSVPCAVIRKKILLKNRINWDNIERAVRAIPWPDVRRGDDPIAILNDHLHSIVERFVPSRVLTLRTGDKPWFDDRCRMAYELKQSAYNRWKLNRTADNWNEFRVKQNRAAVIYSEAERSHSDRAKDILGNAENPHKWWSTLKSSVFGVDPSLPPLISEGGGLVSDSKAKADLLLRHFDSKQLRDDITIPSGCHECPQFTSFAFRSSEVLRILTDLDSYGGVDPLGFFPLLFKKLAAVFAPQISILFRKLFRFGSFPTSWRSACVTPVPKGSLSPVVSNYRPISITPVLSKVFEKLLSSRLSSYLERSGSLPRTQFAYRKGLGTCDALLTVSHMVQRVLDCGGEARIVQLDFSAAFDRVNHSAILHKLGSVGVGGSVLSVIGQFLSNRTQCVTVDGSRSEWIRVVSGVPQGSVLGPLLFSLYTADMYSNLENTLIGYADDSTLLAEVKHRDMRVSVTESLNRDLQRISDWCVMWGMKLNANKTKTMIVSRSRTLLPGFPNLVLSGVNLVESSDLLILGVHFDSKFTFETQLRFLAKSVSQKIGIMRRVWRVFGDRDLLVRCFKCFVLPILEYCSPVWGSAASCHLMLLDRVVRCAEFIAGGGSICDLEHRRSVSALCMFYKIWSNNLHPLNEMLPAPFVAGRVTRGAASAHRNVLSIPVCRTSQFKRSFIPSLTATWNGLADSVFEGVGVSGFKTRANRWLCQLD